MASRNSGGRLPSRARRDIIIPRSPVETSTGEVLLLVDTEHAQGVKAATTGWLESRNPAHFTATPALHTWCAVDQPRKAAHGGRSSRRHPGCTADSRPSDRRPGGQATAG